jgi:hypothetical protein
MILSDRLISGARLRGLLLPGAAPRVLLGVSDRNGAYRDQFSQQVAMATDNVHILTGRCLLSRVIADAEPGWRALQLRLQITFAQPFAAPPTVSCGLFRIRFGSRSDRPYSRTATVSAIDNKTCEIVTEIDKAALGLGSLTLKWMAVGRGPSLPWSV